MGFLSILCFGCYLELFVTDTTKVAVEEDRQRLGESAAGEERFKA